MDVRRQNRTRKETSPHDKDVETLKYKYAETTISKSVQFGKAYRSVLSHMTKTRSLRNTEGKRTSRSIKCSYSQKFDPSSLGTMVGDDERARTWRTESMKPYMVSQWLNLVLILIMVGPWRTLEHRSRTIAEMTSELCDLEGTNDNVAAEHIERCPTIISQSPIWT